MRYAAISSLDGAGAADTDPERTSQLECALAYRDSAAVKFLTAGTQDEWSTSADAHVLAALDRWLFVRHDTLPPGRAPCTARFGSVPPFPRRT